MSTCYEELIKNLNVLNGLKGHKDKIALYFMQKLTEEEMRLHRIQLKRKLLEMDMDLLKDKLEHHQHEMQPEEIATYESFLKDIPKQLTYVREKDLEMKREINGIMPKLELIDERPAQTDQVLVKEILPILNEKEKLEKELPELAG